MSAPVQIPVVALMTEDPPPNVNNEDSPACGQPDELTMQRRHLQAVELAGLLIRIAAHDRAAFADFYDATSSRVYGTVVHILRNPSYSEETVQEIYLDVWNNARKFDPDKGSALAWVITQAHRRSVDRVRSEQSRRTRDTTYSAQSATPDYDPVADTVADSMDAAAVVRCMEALTGKQREAITLAYYRGLTYREVAAHLETSLPTTKSRIRDGLLGLQKCLGVNR